MRTTVEAVVAGGGVLATLPAGAGAAAIGRVGSRVGAALLVTLLLGLFFRTAAFEASTFALSADVIVILTIVAALLHRRRLRVACVPGSCAGGGGRGAEAAGRGAEAAVGDGGALGGAWHVL